MVLAALGFSLMGGSAKLLKGSFNAGQLVFFRNLIGAVGLVAAFVAKPPVNKGGKISFADFSRIYGNCRAVYPIVLHFAFTIKHCNDLQPDVCHFYCFILFHPV